MNKNFNIMKNIILLAVLYFLGGIANQSISCTTFIVSGKYTADGKPLLFKNRDTHEMSNALVLFNDGKYKYMGVVNGVKDSWNKEVWGGYNEKGFAIMNSAAYNNNIGDTTKVPERDGIIMKKALMVCASLNDFEKFLDTLPKPLGTNSNFGVIDAYGGAAYYETGNYKYVKVDANDPTVAPRGIIVRTNHSMSSDLSKGFGYNRFDNATRLLYEAWEENALTPQNLLKTVPRSLYHPRTKTDLTVNIPKTKDKIDFRFFIDYIPRAYTSSSFMIVGAKDAKHTEEAMMWTILGFPLTSVALPAWISANELPKALEMQSDYTAPMCNVALKFKDECFPIKIDKGTNYINLSAVLNEEGTGYWQMLAPIEKEIFNKANLLIAELDSEKNKKTQVHAFYEWLDNYLEDTYKTKFNVDMFK